jgi:hypothetical protein
MWRLEKKKSLKLDRYFCSLETAKHSIDLLGGGNFRKCSNSRESWKSRSYFIYSDHVLIYFENNLPKNVINIENIDIEDGEKSDISKSGLKSGKDRDAIAINLTLGNDSREKMRIVFETLDEAQKFCLLLMYGSASQSAVVEYVQSKDWREVSSALAGPVLSFSTFTLITSLRCSNQRRGGPARILP